MEINTIYNCDCLKLLKAMPENFIDLTVTSPPYDCYSEDTEILTENGWKLIKNVKIGEKVMTLNPHNKNIFYQNVKNVFDYNFDGNLISFKNESMDLLVTENHKMFVTNKDGGMFKGSFLKTPDQISNCCHLPYQGYVYNNYEYCDDYFILPEVTCMYNKQKIHISSKKINMIYWVRFLGIYLAEGSCRNTKNKTDKVKSYEISIKQKDKFAVDLIRDIFKNLPFEYKERIENRDNDLTVFSITDRQLWNYLFKLGNSYEKYVPNEIKNLSAFYLKQLLTYMCLGDGTKRKNFDSKNITLDSFQNYQSFSKRLLDDFQECLLKVGRLSRIRRDTFVCIPKYKSIRYQYIDKTIETYKGRVVCVEVPSHNIVCVRRNGKAVFCGNSIRDYKGFTFDFENMAKELYRVTKEGGVVVWVVGDQTIDSGESLTSFKQAIYFVESAGFKMHDTMIYQKKGLSFPDKTRYNQATEYMFVLKKGKKLNSFNPIEDRINAYAGWSRRGKNTFRNKDGNLFESDKKSIIKEKGRRNNIWYYATGMMNSSPDKIAFEHPATFPELLAEDHIKSWSNEGDLVFDPFMGSGTTLKMAIKNKRNYIGAEIAVEYCDLMKKRFKDLIFTKQFKIRKI